MELLIDAHSQPLLGPTARIAGVCPASEGGFWVADSTSLSLHLFDDRAQYQQRLDLPTAAAGLSLASIYGLYPGGENELLLSDARGRQVFLLTGLPAGIRVQEIGPFPSFPHSVAILSPDLVFANLPDDRVSVAAYDIAGHLRWRYVDPDRERITGIPYWDGKKRGITGFPQLPTMASLSVDPKVGILCVYVASPPRALVLGSEGSIRREIAFSQVLSRWRGRQAATPVSWFAFAGTRHWGLGCWVVLCAVGARGPRSGPGQSLILLDDAGGEAIVSLRKPPEGYWQAVSWAAGSCVLVCSPRFCARVKLVR